MVVMTILFWLGLIKVLWFLASFLRSQFSAKLSLDTYKHGSVCITGATDGIGKRLAHDFLVRGFSVVLVSRSPQKLEKVKNELSAATKNDKITTVVADFSQSHAEPSVFYSELYDRLKDLGISVLINNVGVAEYASFESLDLKAIESMIGVNVYPVVHLTKLFLPVFTQKFEETGQKCLIMNLSSISAYLNCQRTSVYSATTTYISNFTMAIMHEAGESVDVTLVAPGLVKTPMTKHLNLTHALTIVSDADYCNSLLSNLSRGITIGHWKHWVLLTLFEGIPLEVYFRLTGILVPLSNKILGWDK